MESKAADDVEDVGDGVEDCAQWIIGLHERQRARIDSQAQESIGVTEARSELSSLVNRTGCDSWSTRYERRRESYW